jgi:hypothetical protein
MVAQAVGDGITWRSVLRHMHLAGADSYSSAVLDSLTRPHVFHDIGFRTIVDEPDEVQKTQRGQEQHIATGDSLLRVRAQDVVLIHPACLEARQQQQGYVDDHAIGAAIVLLVTPGLVKDRQRVRCACFAPRQRKTLRRDAQGGETRTAVPWP